MNWRKLGHVYQPDGSLEWARSHAYIPTARLHDEATIRVYVAFQNAERVGRIGYVDVAAADPTRVLAVSAEPVLDVGEPGTFDDNGVTPISLLEDQGRLYMFYVGWQLGVKVRYYLFTGLAVSDDGGEHFQRVSRVPILDRSDAERFVRTAAHVHREGERYRMWYVAGDGWVSLGGKAVPTYNIRYLESDDRQRWGPEGRVVIDLRGPDEFGFGRPYVLHEGGCYRMWYGIRSYSRGMSLGYAESPDGITWTRMDERLGLTMSPAGWDAEMVGFPCVLPTPLGTYMFYNGNHYGETGFGVALLEA